MAEGSDAPETLQKQTERTKIEQLLDLPLVKGELWYLLDAHWFNQWKKYINWSQWGVGSSDDPSSHPGCIDNSSLLEAVSSYSPSTGGGIQPPSNSLELKANLTEDMDYVLVPKPAWDLLVEWYSLAANQEPIVRKVVDHGMLSSYLRVEIYLTELKLAKWPHIEKIARKKFSKTDTIEDVEKVFRETFEIAENRNVHLWIRSGSRLYEELIQKNQPIQELSLLSSQTIIGEDGTYGTKIADSRVAPGVSTSSRSSSDGISSSSRSVQPGLCGLNNLGNTCFMNSVLQCMSNTPPVAQYFLEERHWAELNRDNPLGNHGEIAKAFADLLKTMWSGNHHSFPPRAFKVQVGRFAPQFSGYQQHDSQELLTFLLDGLHEDLNRIMKKPYIELKDAEGRSDEEVAQEAWETYRKRNDSVIVDLFHSLLKSTLVCPECGKVSVTFDPTCYLSLPLPVKKERSIDVYLVRLDPEQKTVRFRVIVPKLGTVQDLIEGLSKLCDVPADNLIAADVHQHRFHQIFTAKTNISQINERDTIYVYELADRCGAPGICCLSVYLKEVKSKNNYGYGSMFGVPFILQVPQEGLTYDQLYQLILNRMKRWIKVSQPETGDSNSTQNQCIDNVRRETEVDMETENDVPPSETNSADSGPSHLFAMDLVNSSGNSSINKLKSSSKTITLAAKSFITCEWDPYEKEDSYDAEAAEDYDEDSSFQQRLAVKKQVLQLNECLELFTSTERLGADDAWYCPNCKKHQRATKKFDLWSLPEVLVIHLKRFSYTRSFRDKLDTLVEFPAKGLNMAPYIIDPNQTDAVYDLIGVANHYGGLGGGHYTAYAKNKDDSRWYYFDDSSVSESQEESVCSKAAYVLFYLRRNGNSRWLENVKSPSNAMPSPSHQSRFKRGSVNDSEEEMDSS